MENDDMSINCSSFYLISTGNDGLLISETTLAETEKIVLTLLYSTRMDICHFGALFVHYCATELIR